MWIMSCVTSVSYSLEINGTCAESLRAVKGVRQALTLSFCSSHGLFFEEVEKK